MRSIKCVVVGDGAVGKTSLLISYTTNTFPRDYIPTVFDNYSTTIRLPGAQKDEEPQLYKLNLWDTAGQEEYDRLRPLSYPQTDIFLVCFSISEPCSLKNVVDKWYPEIVQNSSTESSEFHQKLGRYPIFLVGTKADLRDDAEQSRRVQEVNAQFVTPEQVEEVVKQCGFMGYVECSAATQTGVRDVFEKSVSSIVGELEKASQVQKDASAVPVASRGNKSTAETTQQQDHTENRRDKNNSANKPVHRANTARNDKNSTKFVNKMKKKSKCVIL